MWMIQKVISASSSLISTLTQLFCPFIQCFTQTSTSCEALGNLQYGDKGAEETVFPLRL